MRTIPLATTWELFRNGQWGLPGALLGANALPALILTALHHEGPLDLAEESVLVIHVVATLMNAVIFGAAIMAAQGRPSRLYAFPVSTATLVAWQMLPGMAVMFAESAVSTAALNAAFPLDWPVWGPSLFLTCALAAVQAVVWLTEKSAWLLPGVSVVGGGLGVWYQSRYGVVFNRPVHIWREVTPAEMLTLLAVAVLSYVVAVEAVRRDRCGEALRTDLLLWFERLFDPAPAKGLPFRSPQAAQFWFEWRQKGAMPAMAGFAMLVGLCSWALFNRNVALLHEGCLLAGHGLPILGFVMGLVIGCTGPADGKFEMGQFLAARPITNTDLSRIILKVIAWNVIGSWLLWCVAAALLSFILWAAGALPSRFLPPEMQWWHLPAILAGSWLTTAVVASVLLCGRTPLLASLVCGIPTLFIGLIMFEKWAVAEADRLRFHQTVLVCYAVVFLLITAWAFVAARRTRMVQSQTVYASAGAWVAAVALLALDWNLHGGRTLPVQVLVVGFAALALAPIALTPLALAWNRHR
ncbi:MAG: hypothetical protein HY290_30205 [Planctomycetia bacterium]|nr:hypothetical protein [Planctomycetia bacterium]